MLAPKKLHRVAQLGFDRMKSFRKARLAFLQQYVGRFYGQKRIGEEPRGTPINLIYNAVTTLVPNLVYNEPRARVRTNWIKYRPYATALELALNHLVANEINLRSTLRQAITDSIFMAGFIKTGLASSGKSIEIDRETVDIGQPFGERVDPDDMLLDPLARVWQEQALIGNRFRIPKADAMESGAYPPDSIYKLSSRYDYGTGQDASRMSDSTRSAEEANELVEYVDLVEIYIPREKVVVTIPYSNSLSGDEFLRTAPYEGPEFGPYHMLGFAFVPDNLLPVAPASIWYDLHIMANRVARKMARGAERHKQVLAYEASAVEDAAEIVDADDGEAIRVDNIQGIKEVAFGGATDQSYTYIDWAKRQFSEMSMNIDMLSGTRSNEPTATQAEMLQANTSVRLSDMQQLVYAFTAETMRDLAFFLHTDPLIEQPLVKRTRGIDQQVLYTPEMREGDFLDYMISVQPYSMARQDPNIKIRRIMEFAGKIIPAFAQAAQLLGPAFKIDDALALVGREMGIEELDEIINSPLLQAQMERMYALLEAGVPLDPKVLKMIGFGGAMGQPVGAMQPGQSPAMPGGGRPQQPNPGEMIGADISPATEVNQAQQSTAGELQAAYGARPSTNEMALAR